ncbi:hypothetical protein [Curtobacterium sp. MCBD17_028]|uniref:hypothetical protein n=1 Tax=Curtobacterium sp. MCBD17_028 TaxID=2175670 RepID=UPI0015E8EA91|nr:hypothetical protein [Curtobacterium sp. MCBD17_028]
MPLTPPRNAHRDMMLRSKYGFAEAQVIVLRHEEQGVPLAVSTPAGVALVLGFTVPEDALARIPAGTPARMLSIPVHELLRRIPDEWGLVVDIDRPFPQVVQPDEKAALVSASGPFPVGAQVALDRVTRRDRRFIEALHEHAPATAETPRVWVFRHAVESLPEDLLVVVTARDQDAALRYAEAVYDVSSSLGVPDPVTTTWIDELPVEHAMWVRTQDPVSTALGATDPTTT